jgi:hypothetical protein
MLPMTVFGQVDQSVTQVGNSPVWKRDDQGRITQIGNKFISYNRETGVVTLIGNNPVHYSKQGIVSLIGDKAVSFDNDKSPKRFSTIGYNAIVYDNSGKITQMGLNIVLRK